MKLNQFFQSALVLVSAILPILAAPSSNELYPMSQLQRNQDADIPAGLDLLAIDVKGLNEFLNNGTVTSVQLLKAYLHRIDRDNHKGLNLRALIEVADVGELLALAASLDVERLAGNVRGPMHGIPILIKDNVATLGMNLSTTAGSFALFGSTVPRDAHIIKLLREAGAIIIGKANLSEWANFRGGNKNGWSARGGQTSSSYVVGGFAAGGDPCGSSSGSGVGTSSAFAAISIGTETDGSIICPSARAALYGLKPTVGLTSRAGIIPISSTQDSAGPMAKSAYDVAMLLTIIAGFDARDTATQGAVGRTSDYTTAIVPNGFEGLRIGIPRRGFYNTSISRLDPVDLRLTEAAIRRMAELGAVVLNNTDLPSTDEYLRSARGNETVVLNTDFKADIATYLSEITGGEGVKTLEDLINFNDREAAIEMPVGQCCQSVFISAVQSGGLDDPRYLRALAFGRNIASTNGLAAIFDNFGLDVVVIPAAVSSSIAAIVGWPIVTVPIGYYGEGSGKNGQPIGLSFIARPWQERKLIRAIAAFEEAFEKRRVPAQLI